VQERNKHLSEADQLRIKIGDMELRLREREKEALRQVENVKTQAVFSVSPTCGIGHGLMAEPCGAQLCD